MSLLEVPVPQEGLALSHITPGDADFIRLAAYRAAFFFDESPSPEVFPYIDDYTAYFEGWGRQGDTGLIIRKADRPIGAAWYRHYRSYETSWSLKGITAPEVVLSLVPGEKSKGYGSTLLSSLVDLARTRGEEALSLHVNLNNIPALKLYKRLGFTAVEGTYDDGNHYGDIMMLELQNSWSGESFT
jgi:GNAT superfamily N-acetyltransferase